MGIRGAISDANARAEASGEAWKQDESVDEEAVADLKDASSAWDASRETRWDYKTRVLTGGFMGRHKDELDRRTFEAHLDNLGAQGYELCWVLLEQSLHGEKDGHLMIFKRPIRPSE